MLNVKTGLIQCDEARATPGYRIFSPLGALNTFIINMAGEVVHSWDLPFEPGNYGYLLPNGNMLSAVRTPDGPRGLPAKGGLMQERDWDGKVLWEFQDDLQHHDFRRCKNGNTLYLRWELLKEESEKRIQGGLAGSEHDDGIWGDVIREIEADGTVVWEWRAEDCEEMYSFPINPMCPRHEWCHANSITQLNNGDVLINFRYNHLMAIIDRKTKEFKWHLCDYAYGQQHSVYMMENGNIMFFANGANVLGVGPEAGSRVIELNPESKQAVWQYAGKPSFSFFSWFISNAERLASGNTSILEGIKGRLFEVTPEGKIVWEYISPHVVTNEHPMYTGANCMFRSYYYTPDSIEIAGRLPANPW
ncbi:MAG: aryl sulfotransferase [Proteobacteria bacterium]|jgi:hypothetical protein|nr:aryl sulfotransferase [Pseudomonadota bacterium]